MSTLGWGGLRISLHELISEERTKIGSNKRGHQTRAHIKYCH